ncbi:MAG: DUF4224 domain-containing protein [Gammaproteobacteria bacterium]
MFLTLAELEILTGYKRPSCQIKWLKAMRFRYQVSATGRPVVARIEVERNLTSRPEAIKDRPRLEMVR